MAFDMPLGYDDKVEYALDGSKCALCGKNQCTLLMPHSKLHMCSNCDVKSFGYVLGSKTPKNIRMAQKRMKLMSEDKVYRTMGRSE